VQERAEPEVLLADSIDPTVLEAVYARLRRELESKAVTEEARAAAIQALQQVMAEMEKARGLSPESPATMTEPVPPPVPPARDSAGD
jgi:hypothetical protein